jgi:hypothetical protein
MQQIQPAGTGTPSRRINSWRRWAIGLGVLCLLVTPGHSYGADRVSSASKPPANAPFNFDDFTKNKPFRLNTLPTTVVDGMPTPAWADIVEGPENFLECKGASIALCYYSGPEGVTPCELDGPGRANCTCYEIPHGAPYFVDINAILNLDVYLDTVKTCGHDGRHCLPVGQQHAPVCDAINGNKLIPGADVISTFSLFLESEIPIGQTTCETPNIYAGCMTAPCKRTGETDPVTGLPLVQCSCPTFNGSYQVGQDVNTDQCVLGGDNVWSAAFAPNQGSISPPNPPSHIDCYPDVPESSGGCPILSPKPPDVPTPPPNVSCQDVCSEYKQSNQKGVQVGFTCDATLCTATAADSDLVEEACSGLEKHSVSEILKLETEVGLSCAASQICGCEPNKKTNEEIYNLNQSQFSRGISSQCEQNGTLCGEPR